MSAEPMDVSGLPGRYATALFELADEAKAFDRVREDLVALLKMIEDSPDFARLIRSPVIGRDEQARAIDAIMERAGMSDLTRRFVSVVAANRRLFALSDMIRVWLALLARRRGEMRAEVISARPLSDRQRSALEAALMRSVGGNVTIDASVDPTILGGLIVKVGSRLVDSSLGTKLRKLQTVLKGAA